MRNLILSSLVAFLLLCGPVQAQPIALISQGDSAETPAVMAAIDKKLRANGHSLESGTDKGFLILINVVRLKDKAGNSPGLIGYVVVGSQGFKAPVNAIEIQDCREDKGMALMVKTGFSSHTTLADCTTAMASDEKMLGGVMADFIEASLRAMASQARPLLNEAGKSAMKPKPVS